MINTSKMLFPSYVQEFNFKFAYGKISVLLRGCLKSLWKTLSKLAFSDFDYFG